MSYYDHAVMITYRLGPWANAGRDDHIERRIPPRRKPVLACIRLVGRALRTLRHTRIVFVRTDKQPFSQTDACKSHHKGLSAG